MKNFKQLLSELKAGPEMETFLRAHFGSEPFPRKHTMKVTGPEVRWLEDKIDYRGGVIPFTYGVPAVDHVRMEDLPVKHIVHDPKHDNIVITVSAKSYEEDLKKYRISHGDAIRIKSFEDEYEDDDTKMYNPQHSLTELEDHFRRDHKLYMPFHSVEYTPSNPETGKGAELSFMVRAEHVRKQHQDDIHRDDDLRAGQPDF